jgi:hypothetical protein
MRTHGIAVLVEEETALGTQAAYDRGQDGLADLGRQRGKRKTGHDERYPFTHPCVRQVLLQPLGISRDDGEARIVEAVAEVVGEPLVPLDAQ